MVDLLLLSFIVDTVAARLENSISRAVVRMWGCVLIALRLRHGQRNNKFAVVFYYKENQEKSRALEVVLGCSTKYGVTLYRDISSVTVTYGTNIQTLDCSGMRI